MTTPHAAADTSHLVAEVMGLVENIVQEYVHHGDATETCALLESRLTELLAQQEAVAWPPTETAPKDEIVLVAAEFDGPGDWRIKMGYFNPETDRWNVWGASWAPTRWRRLPPPPEVRALTPLLETKEGPAP